METKEGVIKGKIKLEEAKFSFNYKVEIKDGTCLDVSSKNECQDGDKVIIAKNLVPSFWFVISLGE